MSQVHLVEKHLTDVGSISGLEAMALYRIKDLPKIISRLNKEFGYQGDIRHERKKDHTGRHYMRYSLIQRSKANDNFMLAA